MYARIRLIQSGCAEIPIRTNTIPALSSSERGRKAERIPIGKARRSQKMNPPKMSEPVTGAARPISSVTGSRVTREVPRSPWTRLQTKVPYSLTSESCSSPEVSFRSEPGVCTVRKPRRTVWLLPGRMKKRTYVYSVTIRKSTAAQPRRLIR